MMNANLHFNSVGFYQVWLSCRRGRGAAAGPWGQGQGQGQAQRPLRGAFRASGEAWGAEARAPVCVAWAQRAHVRATPMHAWSLT